MIIVYILLFGKCRLKLLIDNHDIWLLLSSILKIDLAV